MPIEKASQYVCLTTLEYAVLGSPLLTTHCPSCGLKLIIKHENIVNRVTSVSLFLGMSVLIGYNMGLHSKWFRRAAKKFFGFFGNPKHDDEGGDKKRSPYDRHRLANNTLYETRRSIPNNAYFDFNGDSMIKSNYLSVEDLDESKMSDRTYDSAIDIQPNSVIQSDIEDCDEQLYDLLAYDNFYGDCYGREYPDSVGDIFLLTPKEEEQKKSLRTQTVDKIDQVLHQIDDIKKSIVEIDDDLFHIAGSTYANFNPDFLTLTDTTLVDEFDDASSYVSSPRRKISDDRSNGGKYASERSAKRSLTSRSISQTDQYERKRKHNITATDSLDSQYKTSSTYAASNSDVDSLQLEWDFESEYEYYDTREAYNTNKHEDKQSPLKEKLSSAANGLDMPMTDEQKLKNMHDLLDEAKKMGLLNNILDALSPSTSPVKPKSKPTIANVSSDSEDTDMLKSQMKS